MIDYCQEWGRGSGWKRNLWGLRKHLDNEPDIHSWVPVPLWSEELPFWQADLLNRDGYLQPGCTHYEVDPKTTLDGAERWYAPFVPYERIGFRLYRKGATDENLPKEEDYEWDADHLPPLLPPAHDHLCHHLLQAVLLWGRPHSEPDQHAGDDDHLHQRDGEAAPHLLPQDDWLLVDILPAGALCWGDL